MRERNRRHARRPNGRRVIGLHEKSTLRPARHLRQVNNTAGQQKQTRQLNAPLAKVMAAFRTTRRARATPETRL
jgi:hypothetical protein